MAQPQLTFKTLTYKQDNAAVSRRFNEQFLGLFSNEHSGFFDNHEHARTCLSDITKTLIPGRDRIDLVYALDDKERTVGAALVVVYGDETGNPKFAHQVWETTTSDIPEHATKVGTLDKFDVDTALRKQVASQYPATFGEMLTEDFTNKKHGNALRDAGLQSVSFSNRPWSADNALVAQGDSDKIKAALPDFVTAYAAAHKIGVERATRNTDQTLPANCDDYQPYLNAAVAKDISLTEPAQRKTVSTARVQTGKTGQSHG